MVNDSRNFALKAATLEKLTLAERRKLADSLVNFAESLKNHLRGPNAPQDAPKFELPEGAKHVPLHIAGSVFTELTAWRAAGKIDGYDLLVLEPHARALMDVCGACERIRSTPLATSYRSLLRIGLGVYLLVSPVYVVKDFDFWAVPIVVLVAFFMLGVEMVAHDVEEPFGLEGDDLPLEKFCTTIEMSVREALRET